MPPKRTPSAATLAREAVLVEREARVTSAEIDLEGRRIELGRVHEAEISALRALNESLRTELLRCQERIAAAQREILACQLKTTSAETELRLIKEKTTRADPDHPPVAYVVDRPLEISTVGLIDRFRPMRMTDPAVPSLAAAREKIRMLALPREAGAFSVETTRARIARGELSEILFIAGANGLKDFFLRGMIASYERNYLMVSAGVGVFPYCFRFDGSKWVDDEGAEMIYRCLVPIAEVYKPRYEKVREVATGAAHTMDQRNVRDRAATTLVFLRPMMDGLTEKTSAAADTLLHKLVESLRPILLI